MTPEHAGQRFTEARSLKAYAGSAPITRASGRSISITRRVVKNNRLNAAGFLWAFAAMSKAGAPQDHYPPTTRPRRSARRCTSTPLHPLPRAAPLLLANRSTLRPDQGVRACSECVLRDRCLTSWGDRRSSSARSRSTSTPNSPRSDLPATGHYACVTPCSEPDRDSGIVSVAGALVRE